MEKGILTKSLESLVANWLDDVVKLKRLGESIDGIAFKMAITQLDDYFGDKIPEPYKTTIQTVATTIFEEKDYNLAVSIGLTFMDSQIDIPGIDDETELLIFKGLETIIFAILAKLNING